MGIRFTTKTQVSTVNNNAYFVTDNTAGTNRVEIISKDNLFEEIRNGATAADLAKLAAITAGSAELNILDGVTANAGEINVLDGISVSTSQINELGDVDIGLLDGVASSVVGVDEQQAINSNTITSSLGIAGSGNVRIDTSGAIGNITATLPAISRTKSEEILVILEDATFNGIVLTNAGDAGFVDPAGNKGDTITMNSADEFVYLKSSCIVGGRWMILGGEGYTLTIA